MPSLLAGLHNTKPRADTQFLRQLARWVIAALSFNFVQLTSPECSLPDGWGTLDKLVISVVLTQAVYLAFNVVLTFGDCINPQHSANAR